MDATEEKIRDIMKTIAAYLELYPSAKLSKQGLFLYSKALSRFGVKEIDAAFLKLLETRKFWPAVSEVIETIESLRATYKQAQGAGGEPTAAEAWEEAWRLAKECFVYKPWHFSCPAVEKAVNQFGKAQLCELTPDGMNTARAQFMRIYTSVANKQREQKQNADILRRLGAKLPVATLESIKAIGNGGRV